MELISAYVYNKAPIQMENLSTETLHNLFLLGWSKDERELSDFYLLRKTYKIEDKYYYRCILRFRKKNESLILDNPVPFTIVQTEPVYRNDDVRWNDLEVFHGRTIKTTLGYIQKGIPFELIDKVIADLRSSAVYIDPEGHSDLQRLKYDLLKAFNLPDDISSLSDLF